MHMLSRIRRGSIPGLPGLALAPTAAAATVALVLAAAPARGDDDGYARRGLYLGVGGSYSTALYEDELEDATGVSSDIDDSFGVNAKVGYRLASFFALEADYEWIDEYDVEIEGIDAATVESQTITGNAKILLPTWRLQPYIVLGIGATRWELEDTLDLGLSETEWSFAGRVGGGVDLYLTRNLVLDAGIAATLTAEELDQPSTTDDITGVHYLAVRGGLQYRF